VLANLDAVKNKRVYKFPQFNRSPDAAEIYLSDDWLARVANPDALRERRNVPRHAEGRLQADLSEGHHRRADRFILELEQNKDSAGYVDISAEPTWRTRRSPGWVARAMRDLGGRRAAVAAAGVCAVYSITLGRYDIAMWDVWLILWDNVVPAQAPTWTQVQADVVEVIRLPRILGGTADRRRASPSRARLCRACSATRWSIPASSASPPAPGFGGTLAILLVGGGYPGWAHLSWSESAACWW
jgi:hypothetical protein